MRNFAGLVFGLGLVVSVPGRPVRADEMADFRPLILKAAKSGEKKVVIPPGVYRVGPNAGDSALFTMQDTKNLEIVADGVTMLCTKRMRALQFNHCENVTLRGMRIDYDPLTFTQGKVSAIAPDKGWLDVKLDAGYPRILLDRIVICDPKTRFHKYGINHLWGTKASWDGPDTIRITRPDVAVNVDLGDPVALSGGQEMGACHGITVENGSSNVTFRDVTLNCAPGMGIIDFDSNIGMRMFGCKIVPGPKPAGATEERLLTTSWDGIQCQVARVGSRVEDCVIERCGDDSWSVPDRGFKVLGRDGNTLLLAAPMYAVADGGIRAGDHLVRRGDLAPSNGTIKTIEVTSAMIDGKDTKVIKVLLDGDMAAEAGQYLFDLDCSSKGFTYRNNHIYSHGRGALVKVGDGFVEGNTFRGSDKAVMVNPESANGGLEHLVIRNNTIIETGYHQAMPWSEQAGAICLSSSAGYKKLRPAGVFDDVVIEGNTLDGVKGLNLLISSASNVLVRNNKFLNTHQTDPGDRHNGADYGLDPTAVIEVSDSDGVKFEGNVVLKMGPFVKRVILVTPSAVNVRGVDSGIKVEGNG